MIRVRFIGFPKENDQDAQLQSQCLFETDIDTAPDVGEKVIINMNVYTVRERKWYFTTEIDEYRSLLTSREISKVLNVYLKH